jgi:O-antigen/teichoic acid export membrane protein
MAEDLSFDPTATTPFGPWRAVGWGTEPLPVVTESDQPAGGDAAARGRPGRLRGLARRLTWGLADQAVSSLTNFAVSLYVARTLGALQFGAFSLAYVTYSFVLNASRGLATDPLLVRFSGASTPDWRRAVTACTGTATAVGLVAGAGMVAVGVLLSGTARAAFIAMGVTMPGLMLQDSWRFAFFAHGRGGQAFLNDSIWALAMLPGLLALRITGHETVFWFVLAWGAAANVAALAGPIQARIIPRLTRAWSWVMDHRDLSFRYLAEETFGSVTGQLRAYGLALIVGLAAVGYVQASSTLMGPFFVIMMGISLVTVPEAARVLKTSPRHLRLFCVLLAAGLAIAAAAWGGFLLLALPRGLGAWLLAGIWRPTYPLILPLTIAVMGSCICSGATAGLRALGGARRSLRAEILGSGAFVVCTLVGAYYEGAIGAVRGGAVATLFGAVIWWWQLQAGIKESGTVQAALVRRSSHPPGRHRSPESSGPRPWTASPGRRHSPSGPRPDQDQTRRGAR